MRIPLLHSQPREEQRREFSGGLSGELTMDLSVIELTGPVYAPVVLIGL